MLIFTYFYEGDHIMVPVMDIHMRVSREALIGTKKAVFATVDVPFIPLSRIFSN